MLEGKAIKVVPNVKFLGVWFDTKSCWEKQIQMISNKCYKGINLLRCIAGIKWGAHPMTMINLYKTFIHFDYAGTLINSATKTRKQKLQRIQNRALRIAFGAMQSTPRQILNYETLEPPLHIRRSFLTEKFLLKRKITSNHIIFQKIDTLKQQLHTQFWNNKQTPLLIQANRSIQQLGTETYRMQPYYLYDYFQSVAILDINIEFFRKSDANIVIENSFLEYLEKKNYDQIIYTDGSVHLESERSSFAYFNETTGNVTAFAMNFASSSFHAELMAILKALESIKDMERQKILLCSDSKSALNTLKNNCFENNNLNLKSGHKNIRGNEIADQAANEAYKSKVR